jgi:hypothetical protein
MGRRPRVPLPWRRADRGNDWYITIKRGSKYVQQWLASADTDEVKLPELAAKALTEARVHVEGQHLTFRLLVADFLAYSEKNVAPRTAHGRRQALTSFLTYLDGHSGVHFLAKDLKPYHVTGWIDAHPSWGPSAQRTGMERLLTCLSWGRKQGFLEVNPLEGRLKCTRPANPRP